MELFDENTLESIKCILSQEEELSGADRRLESIGMYAYDPDEDRVFRARRWGLFDGYNYRFRSPELGGIVHDNMVKARQKLLSDIYFQHYDYGKQLKIEMKANS